MDKHRIIDKEIKHSLIENYFNLAWFYFGKYVKSMSAAFTIFAKKVGREKRIPFEVSVDPFYSEGNIRYLEKIMLDIKEGRANFAEHELMEND